MDRQTPSGGSTGAHPDAGETVAPQNTEPINSQQESSVAHAAHHLLNQLAALFEFANHFLAARFDSIKLSIFRLALVAIVWLLAVVILAGLVLTGTVLLGVGLAEGLSRLFHSYWLGYLAAGVAILGGFIGVCILAQRLLLRSSHRKTVARYDARRAHQRATFGRDAE
jgi:hypothetical protein